jgi:hypothetical protein
MISRLDRYLELERLMLILDEAGDATADVMRDAMDPIWYQLTDDERRLLDERSVGVIETMEGIRVPSGSAVFGDAPDIRHSGLVAGQTVGNWKMAA